MSGTGIIINRRHNSKCTMCNICVTATYKIPSHPKSIFFYWLHKSRSIALHRVSIHQFLLMQLTALQVEINLMQHHNAVTSQSLCSERVSAVLHWTGLQCKVMMNRLWDNDLGAWCQVRYSMICWYHACIISHSFFCQPIAWCSLLCVRWPNPYFTVLMLWKVVTVKDRVRQGLGWLMSEGTQQNNWLMSCIVTISFGLYQPIMQWSLLFVKHPNPCTTLFFVINSRKVIHFILRRNTVLRCRFIDYFLLHVTTA